MAAGLGCVHMGWIPSKRMGFLILIVSALLMRVALFSHEPSNDVYRYLWEGKIQLAGFNPYETPPSDNSLEFLRDSSFSQINHPTWTAIYGPLAELIFRALCFVSPTVNAWKLLILIVDLSIILLLVYILRESPGSQMTAIGYAWNPLVLWSFSSEAHLDCLAIFAILGMIFICKKKKPVLAGVFLGLAIIIKPTMGVCVPVLLLFDIGKLKAIVSMTLTIFMGYLPFMGAGNKLFTSLTRFGSEMKFNDLPGIIPADLVPHQEILILILGLTLLFLVSLISITRLKDDPAKVATLLIGVSILVSPTVHPWYGTPLAATNSITNSLYWWVLTITLVVSLETAALERATGIWTEPDWVRFVVYLPVLLTAIFILIVNKKKILPENNAVQE